MKRVHTDRSRIQDFQRCPRLRFLSYHQNGLGLSSVRTPLPLSVGSSVHCGLAVLLHEGQQLYNGPDTVGLAFTRELRSLEDHAVAMALADFAQYTLDPPDAERQVNAAPDFDDYLKQDQSALVESLVRAYSRRRLRPLLEQFEVLEVEREGQWQLAEVSHDWVQDSMVGEDDCRHCRICGVEAYIAIPKNDYLCYELRFMSRPDALLRERASNELYLLSYKTTGSWDARKARDAEHDMQGLSEGVEVERRLAEWWDKYTSKGMVVAGCPAMTKFLQSCSAPPRILGIRYEYLLKGERWRDKDLSARFGFDARVQRSHLIRGYLNAGMAAGDEQWNHAWEYLKPDGSGETSKLNYRQWHSEPVWTHMPIARWIDMLDDAAMLSVEGADRGYQCAAQATGTTQTHPLDDVFIPPLVVYRNSDDLRDWVESTEYQEREVAEHVALVEAAQDEGEKRSLLNRYFPMTRRACSYPTECAFSKSVCYAGAEAKEDPLSTGLFQIRVANHPIETEGR